MPLGAGQIFAGYTVVRLLGSGGMGEVYLAKHPRLPRHDALKVLPTAISADPDFRTRFEREADLAATLWHPHIVGVHDRGDFEGRLWISMDYVAGHDAAALLRDQYPTGMPADQVATIVTAVAEALDHAHHRQLLHRDVKPANILLTDDPGDKRRILLADFGIARHTEDTAGLTATNMTVGSVNYTAPEQLMGEPIDGRTDQYALAATAYHLLTGTPPFPHPNPAVVISRHLNTTPPPLATTHPPLAAADPILATALAKNPTDRYPTTTDFATALTQALTGQTPTTTTTSTSTTAPSAPSAPSAPARVTLTDSPTTYHEKPPAEPPPVHVSQWGTPPTNDEKNELLTPTPPAPVDGLSSSVRGRSSRYTNPLGVVAAVVILVAVIAAIALHNGRPSTSSDSSPTTTAINVPEVSTTTKTTTLTQSSSPASRPSATTTPVIAPARQYTPGNYPTIATYIKDNGITETAINKGDPGSPTLDLPIPAGWEAAGARMPSFAWGAIIDADSSMSNDPPSIIAILSRLTGPVDAASVLGYAAGELNNLPGFDGPSVAESSTLSGFDAVQLGGSYIKDGVKRVIAQKTVVIPSPHGLFVLQLNADGLESQRDALMAVTDAIDKQTVITP
jgi:serine/threonine protein kinase, bacterial